MHKSPFVEISPENSFCDTQTQWHCHETLIYVFFVNLLGIAVNLQLDWSLHKKILNFKDIGHGCMASIRTASCENLLYSDFGQLYDDFSHKTAKNRE